MEPSPAGKDSSGSAKKAPPRRTTKSTLDLDEAARLLQQFQSRELPEEMQARLKRELEKDGHERWKEKIVVIFTIIVASITFVLCTVVIFWSGNPEDKKWAMATLASIVSASVGYLGGRASKPD